MTRWNEYPNAYIFENWFFAPHFGYFIPWYTRLIWLFFGLLPLFLGVTGVLQWWIMRKKKIAWKQRRAVLAAAKGSVAR